MNIDLSRRGFLRLAGAGVAATSLGAMGFGEAEAAEAARISPRGEATRLVKLLESEGSLEWAAALRRLLEVGSPDE